MRMYERPMVTSIVLPEKAVMKYDDLLFIDRFAHENYIDYLRRECNNTDKQVSDSNH